MYTAIIPEILTLAVCAPARPGACPCDTKVPAVVGSAACLPFRRSVGARRSHALCGDGPSSEVLTARGPHCEGPEGPRDETPRCPALHTLHENDSRPLCSRHRGVHAQGIEKGQGGESRAVPVCLRLRRRRSSPKGPHHEEVLTGQASPCDGRARPEPPSQPKT